MKRLYASIVVLSLCLLSGFAIAGDQLPTNAAAGGKYTNLIQTLDCPEDKSSYGEFNDYGYWGGGQWHDKQGSAGYWVYVAPKWHVWKDQVTKSP